MTKSYSIRIIGKVQGVGFRFYTRKKALELGVRGFVRNMSDGSVLIEAEGEAQNIDEFTRWLNHGPEWARVEDVQIQEKPEEGFAGFHIR